MNELDLFAAAIAIVDPAEQDSFLDRECAGRPELRQRLNHLIGAHRHSHPMLDHPGEIPAQENHLLSTPTVAYPNRDLQPGSVIADKYKLLEKIGEGGMGEVWVADQVEPINRRIALKLIKPGMDSRSVLARFEAERQALALMDHPNIAKVLDAGTTAEGRPYFVMELVKGTPITEFCDVRRLTPKQRLELFVSVCQAIQHAHTKGIIHRDIKPSNVLVALHDELPVPKVIDFGVAKAVGQQLTEKTIYTGFGGLVGTPTYMAPEQATFNQLDIDTRADVYALGVLLYELLAGSPPVEPERLKKAALDEVLRLVRDEEPPRPSQRLSTSQSRSSIAAVRKTDPDKLSKLIRGELDWMVMKALEKDRNRRYETANGFAADVQRYLAGETVQAVPPSVAYQLRKFARKNRALLATAAAFTLVLIAATGVSSWLAVLARQAEVKAKDHAEEADYYTKLFRETAEEQMIARHEAMISATSLQIDFDLLELPSDRRTGLLRLIQRSKETEMRTPSTVKWEMSRGQKLDFTMPANLFHRQHDLQELVTAAVITSGQEFAGLQPPITHDGIPVFPSNGHTSPNQQTLLTWGEDGTVRLWDIWNARQKAILRHENERIVHPGYNSDGLTAFTLDDTGVVRFWDTANGTLRTQAQLPPDFYTKSSIDDLEGMARVAQLEVWSPKLISRSSCVIVGKDRMITRHVVAKKRPNTGTEKVLDQFYSGPVELWDTTTGQLVAQLEVPDAGIEQVQFLEGGRWITTLESPSTVMVFSAADGRFVSRLALPEGQIVTEIHASPSNQRVVTLSQEAQRVNRELTLWDTASWKRTNPVLLDKYARSTFKFMNEQLFTFSEPTDIVGTVWDIYRIDAPAALVEEIGANRLVPPVDHLIVDHAGVVIDTKTRHRLAQPLGRRFHPALAKFAADGRFVVGCGVYNNTIIDTRTEKQFDAGMHFDPGIERIPLYQAGMGYAWVIGPTQHQLDTSIRRFPAVGQLDIPASVLELWAQVAVRGELDSDGTFKKWDEATWETKRQELAAVKPPYSDFPFPGHVATDKLHWLRAEYKDARSDAEKLRWASELLRRAEAKGDRIEAVRWRAEQKRLSAVQGEKK